MKIVDLSHKKQVAERKQEEWSLIFLYLLSVNIRYIDSCLVAFKRANKTLKCIEA